MYTSCLCLRPISPLTYSSKPLVSLFPASLKQNLLSFVYLIHSALPQTSVLRLLKCLSQDPRPDPWISALCRQIRRSVGVHDEEPLYTPHCSQRLKELSQRLVVRGETGGWAKCDQTVESGSQSASSLSELGTQRKRKVSLVTVDSGDEETGQQSKRIRMDVCGSEQKAEEQDVHEETSERLERETPAEELQPAPDCQSESLPEHIKVREQIHHPLYNFTFSLFYFGSKELKWSNQVC